MISGLVDVLKLTDVLIHSSCSHWELALIEVIVNVAYIQSFNRLIKVWHLFFTSLLIELLNTCMLRKVSDYLRLLLRVVFAADVGNACGSLVHSIRTVEIVHHYVLSRSIKTVFMWKLIVILVFTQCTFASSASALAFFLLMVLVPLACLWSLFREDGIASLAILGEILLLHSTSIFCCSDVGGGWRRCNYCLSME